MSSSFITVPKTSVINIPLLVALLITSILHFLVISELNIHFPETAPQHNRVEVTLLKPKTVTQVSPVTAIQKPAEIKPEVAEIPTPKSEPSVIDSTTKPAPKKRRRHTQPVQKTTVHRKKPVLEPTIAKSQPEPVLSAPDSSELAAATPAPPVEPVIAEPTPEPKLETPAAVAETVVPPVKPAEVEKPVAVTESAQPELLDKPVTAPAKTNKKARKKSARKSSSSPENTQPTLSMDDLAAQIAQVGEKFGTQAPTASESRIKTLSAVRKHKASAQQYKQDWRRKIEGIANLNFPEAARQKDFSARLIIEVGINADGSIHSLRVKKSSGTPPLDEAAKNIVQMGAPFAPLPKDLAEEIDVLVLQQPMQFSDESGVTVQ